MTYIPARRSDGTIQHARIKQPWPKDRLFRILSVDGGGIRGIFPAAYLTEIERRFLNGKSIATYFDMITGTSTGGIIALALAQGMTAAEALKIYVDRGERIFPILSGVKKWRRALNWIINPKHDSSVLKNELLTVFGAKLMDDANTRLVIPSFEGLQGEPLLYKTPHHPDYTRDRHKLLAHVAQYTTAAPTYYAGIEDDGYVMIDGGLWANNPIMNALVDTMACYDVPRENIRILSVGTGSAFFTINEQTRKGGLKKWALRLFDAASRAQSLNALGQAFLLIGKHNIIRIDPPETSQSIPLDDVKRSLLELPPLARSLAEASGHLVEGMFLADAVDPFIKCPQL